MKKIPKVAVDTIKSLILPEIAELKKGINELNSKFNELNSKFEELNYEI
jgi:FtsZ-binding cell division protein ZapB